MSPEGLQPAWHEVRGRLGVLLLLLRRAGFLVLPPTAERFDGACAGVSTGAGAGGGVPPNTYAELEMAVETPAPSTGPRAPAEAPVPYTEPETPADAPVPSSDRDRPEADAPAAVVATTATTCAVDDSGGVAA